MQASVKGLCSVFVERLLDHRLVFPFLTTACIVGNSKKFTALFLSSDRLTTDCCLRSASITTASKLKQNGNKIRNETEMRQEQHATLSEALRHFQAF